MTNATKEALPEGTHLAYTIYHETHWWRGLPSDARPSGGRPTIQVAASARGAGGGVAWEFAVVEYDISGPTLRLEMFADAFDAFRQIPEFFGRLPVCESLRDVRAVLHAMGAVDETERGTTRAEERRTRLERAAEVLYTQATSETGMTPEWERQPNDVRQGWLRKARVVLDAAEGVSA